MRQDRKISKRRGRRRELGQALIEFSLVMSILLVPIVAGMAGFAAYLGNFLALTDAVSFGAKQLSVNRGAGSLDPCALVTTAVTQSYRAAATETGTPTPTVTLTIYNAAGTVTGTANSSGSCTSYATDMVQGGTIMVSATEATQSIFGSYGSFSIKAQTQEMVQ
jgi:hypothetical protein